jgi:hypothetical protein
MKKSTPEEDARRLFALADRERAIARWADGLRVSIRLGRPIKVSEMHQRGPFGRKRRYLYELDDRMPAAAANGLYRALEIVQREAEARAGELVAQVTVNGSAKT